MFSILEVMDIDALPIELWIHKNLSTMLTSLNGNYSALINASAAALTASLIEASMLASAVS